MTFYGGVSSAINWDSGGSFYFFWGLDFYHIYTTVLGLGLIVGIFFSVAVDALKSFQVVSFTRLSQWLRDGSHSESDRIYSSTLCSMYP
jgi:hypothetical protein